MAQAKARLSELLNTCLTEGPQTISRRGEDVAVMVPLTEWQRLQDGRPTLKSLLTSDDARFELVLPPRGRAAHRHVEVW